VVTENVPVCWIGEAQRPSPAKLQLTASHAPEVVL